MTVSKDQTTRPQEHPVKNTQESQMHEKALTPDTLTDLMLRNLIEVFSERDSERRMAAIKNLYSKDAVFFEAEKRFEGRQAISDAIAALLASFPAEFEFSAAAPPARNHDVGRLFWRFGPAGSPPVVNGMDVVQFKDGRIHSLYVFLNDQGH
jgi:SnoaL-like domain